MSEVILRKGDVITCEEGHEVCTVVDDLYPETLNWGTHFGEWQQVEPVVGRDRLPLYCSICGAPYMAQTYAKEGEWYDLGDGKSMGVAATPIHTFVEGQGWVPPIPEDLGPVPRGAQK